MNKRRIATLILLGLSAFIVTLTFAGKAFGWWLNLKSFGNVKLQITKINSEVYLYKGIDQNINGIPDELDDEIEALLPENPYPSSKAYYEETKSFSFVAKEYALSTSSTGDLEMRMDAGVLFPTQKAVFKFACINNSDMENWITFSYNSKTYTSADDLKTLSAFSVRVGRVVNNDASGDVTSSDTSIQFSEKVYFCDYISSTAVSTFDVIDSESAERIGGCLEVVNNSNCADFWFQIELETYDNLVDHNADIALTETEYQALQGKEIEFPTLKLSLELRVGD